MVLKSFGKWEMTWKNLDSLSGFSVIRAKNFQVAMLLCYPGFWASAEVLLREFTFYFYFMFSQYSMLWLTLYYRLPIRSSSLINLSVINQLQFINAFFVGYHEIIM